jgi:alpha-tubulin suppressor-like RCC1 family protein
VPAAATGLAALIAACATSKTIPSTGLEVIVADDGLSAPADFDDIRLEVSQQVGGGGWNRVWNRDYLVPSAEATLPATFAIGTGVTPDEEALVVVTAFKGGPSGQAVVQRVAQVQLPTDRVAALWMVLAQICEGQVTTQGPKDEPVSTCPTGQSCQPGNGECGSNAINDPGSLSTYAPGEGLDAGLAAGLVRGDGGRPVRANTPDGGDAGQANDGADMGADGSDDAGGTGVEPDGNGGNGTCANACSRGQAMCGAGGIAACAPGDGGCWTYGPAVACPGAHQSCTGSPGSASCTCTADPVCGSATNVCANPSTVAGCASDAYGCFYQASSTDCGSIAGTDFCFDGQCVSALALAVGSYSACAVLSTGGVACWGENGSGQLGDGTTSNSAVPVAVAGIGTATAVSLGYDTACALLSGGTVACWGLDDNGQLGNGTASLDTCGSSSCAKTPVTVAGVANATALSVGYEADCALVSGGGITCWGYNDFGQLGNGNKGGPAAPVAVSGVTTATSVSIGQYSACAVVSGGNVVCWGDNGFGQLGNGATNNSSVPVPVSGIQNARAVSVGDGSACALLSSGGVVCWGESDYGQLGNGNATGPEMCGGTACSTKPVTVSGITSATAISLGNLLACALLSNGHIECWGSNALGELGDATWPGPETCGSSAACSSKPVAVSGIGSAKSVAAGSSAGGSACALVSAGGIECWGYSADGQLGDGTTGPEVCASSYPCSTTPVAVQFAAP